MAYRGGRGRDFRIQTPNVSFTPPNSSHPSNTYRHDHSFNTPNRDQTLSYNSDETTYRADGYLPAGINATPLHANHWGDTPLHTPLRSTRHNQASPRNRVAPPHNHESPINRVVPPHNHTSPRNRVAPPHNHESPRNRPAPPHNRVPPRNRGFKSKRTSQIIRTRNHTPVRGSHPGVTRHPTDETSPRFPIVGSPQETPPRPRSPLTIYLEDFLLSQTCPNFERILPRKILNTTDLFCKILRKNTENTATFNKILIILTSCALCDVKYRTSEAVNKVHILVDKELRSMPLENLTRLAINELSSDEPSHDFENKKTFEERIFRLLESYSINHRVKLNILNVLKEDLNIDIMVGEIDTVYSDCIKSIHSDIENVIRHGCSVVGSTLSQFITSMLPPPDELLEKRPVPPNPLIITGEYPNTRYFLSTHYSLLREDMVQPLRRSLANFLAGDSQARKSLYIYDQVKFLYPECDLKQGLMYRVQFNVKGARDVSRIKWDRCERLKYGTLLCIVKLLETDKPCFKEILWGIVSNRDTKSLQNDLQISLKFSSGFESRVDFSQTYMMLESREVYFESYCHTLSVLNNMEHLPFTDVLLGKSLVCSHPQYLNENTLFDLSPIFPDRDLTVFQSLGRWPDASPTLDESQYRALRLALTKEVSLIQGPPGTGKTYVGAIMLEILLQTKQSYYLKLESQLFDKPETRKSEAEIEADEEATVDNLTPFTDQESFMSALESPILILTYTNHALDQFLTLLLRFESRIIRIGSKVEQDELLPHCLTEIRKKLMPTRYMRSQMENLPFLPRHVLGLKKERDNLNQIVYTIRDRMAGVGNKLSQNRITLHEVSYLCLECQHRSIYEIVSRISAEEMFAYWKDGGELYENNEVKIVIESPPKSPAKRRRTSMVEELHSASDDEDNVDDIRMENDDEEFEEEKKRIFQWDNLSQVMSVYELNQIKARLPDIPERVLGAKNLWSLSKEDRSVLYKHWLALKQKMLLLMVEEMSEQFSVVCADIEVLNRQIDLCILKEAAVIGMTTTGAAKNSQLIQQLKPRIVVVEEAAEVLEAHIIANLTPQVQHLILIGDHQQLRPSNAEFELSKFANIDISLFERLIKNGMEHVTLNYQHRMRPEISSLVRPIYPNLLDHDVVTKHDVVYGVKENIFFIDHDIPEDHADQDNVTTKKHTHEAIYLAHLANYLLSRGYRKDEITILTFYQGQKFSILDELRKLDIRLRVSTVDKYQGEENRVILFSVVRSNKQNNIGHCRIDNRVCVALSRAKDGLFMIGNSASLRKASTNTKSDLWNKVLDLFGASRTGKTFPLICHRHPESCHEIHNPEEFLAFSDAFCKLPCNEQLECGHKCLQLCHYNRKVPCKELCDRINPDCGHPCVREDGKEIKFCHERCGRCNYLVLRKLPFCDHETILPCYLDILRYRCEEICERKPDCGHPCVQGDGETRKHCHEKCGNCNYFVNKRLQICDHEKMVHCHSYPYHHLCEQPCEKMLNCGHPCKKICSDDCGPCEFIAEKTTEECGHRRQLPCSIEPTHDLCDRPCKKILPCGHSCVWKCNETCSDFHCERMVMKYCPCGHKNEMMCYFNSDYFECTKQCLYPLPCNHICPLTCDKDCEDAVCEMPCERKYKCGHLCFDRSTGQPKKCSEKCGGCLRPVLKKLPICGHEKMVPCTQSCEGVKCKAKATKELPCKHVREVTCCVDTGKVRCTEKCTKLLICGHPCTKKCFEDCSTTICKASLTKKQKCGHTVTFSCHEEQTDSIPHCLEACEKTLECGHLCFDRSTGQPKKCSEKCGECLRPVLKKLPICGHEKMVPCTQSCEGVKCKAKATKELPCKHVREVTCCVDTGKVKCTEKCTKLLICGHPCTKKCFEDCSTTKCKASLTKKQKCGHTVTFSCHEEQTDSIPHCPEACDKTLECGHACNGDCGDDCSEIICQVKLRLKLNCSHSIQFICSKGSDKYFENALDVKHVIHCQEKTCKICKSIKCLVKCDKKCAKNLGCGHKCREVCHHPFECLPCKVNRQPQCIHRSKSAFLCGDDDTRCEENCEWECKHHTCMKKCWEPCTRPVCDEPCSLERDCGHPCLGLCGEICPEVCNTCDRKNDMFHKTVSTPCIQLDCSHIFAVKRLDEYFDTIQDGSLIPTCPNCKLPFYKTFRYGGIIKNIMLKKEKEKSSRKRRTLIHITEDCKRVFRIISFCQPLTKFTEIIEILKSGLENYQLTKLYTVLELLNILSGLVNHLPEVWTSHYHKKLLQSKTLQHLTTQTQTNSGDCGGIDWIRKLVTRCELCSIFTVINTRHKELSSKDALYLKDNYQEIFADNRFEESKCITYLEELTKLVSKYDIEYNKSRCSLSRPLIENEERVVCREESCIGTAGGQEINHGSKRKPSVSKSPSNITAITFCNKTDAKPILHSRKVEESVNKEDFIPRTLKRSISSTQEPKPKHLKLSPTHATGKERDIIRPSAVRRRSPRNPRREHDPSRQPRRSSRRSGKRYN